MALNLLLTQHRGPIHSLAPPRKQDSSLGVNTHWERHIIEDEALLSVHKQNDPALEFIQKPSSKVTDVLLNAKSRYVG